MSLDEKVKRDLRNEIAYLSKDSASLRLTLAARDAEIAQLKLVASFPQSKVEQALKAKCERYLKAINQMSIIINWNADQICRCYTNEYKGRHPTCQYHAASDAISEALKQPEGEKG